MGMIEERQVAIVDTPGLFDTNHISNESTKEIIRCMHLSYPGPHAFLLVLKADRFTDEENDTVTSLLDLFGDHMLSYTVVIFTRLDDLEEDGTTLGEYIESSTEALKRLIKSVQFRIIAFNNKGNADQKTSYVSSLHRIINKMQQVNDGKHYTSEMFKEAKSKIQEKIRTAERKKETENQRVFKLVEHKFKSEIRNAERSSSRLQNELCKQKEQHKSIETEHQESQERIVNMQENLSRTKIYNQTELRESIEEENQKVEAKLNARRKQQYRSKPVFTSSWIRNDEQRMKNLADENKMQIRIQKIQLQKQTEEVIRILTYKLKKEREAEVQRQLFQEKRERERIHLQNKNLSNMLNEIEETKRQKELQQRQPNSRRSFFRHSTASPIQTDNVQTTYYENSDDDSSCVIL
ncbi:GTPase IMAP family member 9-like [Mytilus trossulus]|uniref:GTPase IMAP family member 9-like n=1 Tax=Mytilus trossulus TaxID=6551 RepID=UPI0030074D19